MMRRLLPLAVTVLVAACATPAPEQQIVAGAAEALGGRERISALSTLVLEGEGTHWNLGQDMTMEASGQSFAVTGYRRTLDLTAPRMRVEQTRTPNFLYFQGQAAQKQIFGVDADVAYTVAANGTVTRSAAGVVGDRRADYFHHPITLVRAALDGSATVVNPRTEAAARVVDITVGGAGPFSLAVDAAGLPSRISSRSYNANLGDVVIETTFDDYIDVNGLKVPQHITTMTDRYKTAELRLARPAVNSNPGDVAAPEAARSAAAPGPATVNVAAEQLSPGVWLLAGQGHHSALIEFDDHLMLVEAPQSEARTLAVIAKARELAPGKPLTELVTSHHHFDHTAGLRAAIAEGLKVITQQANVAYFEDAAKRPHTIVADVLARGPKPAIVEGVGDARVIEDKNRRVELYHIAGNPHGDTLLMVYLPKDRLLIEADVFSPGSAVHPYAPNLLDQIRQRKLRVDRIAPLHGTVVPFSALEQAVPTS